jgi:hypothetical protein
MLEIEQKPSETMNIGGRLMAKIAKMASTGRFVIATLALAVIVMVFAVPVVTAQTSSQCDGLLSALGNIPSDSPGYARVVEIAQNNCGRALDHAALVALYYSTDGDNWLENQGWFESIREGAEIPHCDWFGVSCNSEGRVRALVLFSNNLSGDIPAELGNLTGLDFFSLYDNQLTGSIPTSIGNLRNLEVFLLSINDLTGSIPVELANLSNLDFLTLAGNQLSGSIPAELGRLGKLEFLSLGANQLTGSIPTELADLSNLEILGLEVNNLSGSIPPELGNLSKLRVLDLGVNQLSGSIPTQLGNLHNLESLSLAVNEISGSIPVELTELQNLHYLNLRGNQLTGTIPAQLSELTNLLYLYLDVNGYLCWETQTARDVLLAQLIVYLGTEDLCSP